MAGNNSVVGLETITFTDNMSFDGTERGGAMTTNGQLWIGSTPSRHVRLGNLTSSDNSLIITNGPGTIDLKSNPAVVPDLHTAKWIVNSTPLAGGNQTTISAAIAAASPGDTIFIMPGATGIYTENFTLPPNINLVAFNGDQSTPHVTINGKITMTAAGTSSISNIRLKTNGDFAIAVTGSANSIIIFNDCFILGSNNTALSYTTSGASASLQFYNCFWDVSTSGIAYFASTSAGSMLLQNCFLNNSGGSTTASTFSSGLLEIISSEVSVPITTSGNASLRIFFSDLQNGLNTTSLTHGGSGANSIVVGSRFDTGTASGVSIGAGATLLMNLCSVNSSNANAVTGLGTLLNAGISFGGSSNVINTTTVTARNFDVGGISFDGGTNNMQNYSVSTWTPTITGASVAGTTTYTSQNGYYTRIGNLIQVQCYVAGSAATGTGNVVLGGLPFTIKNQTNGYAPGCIISQSAAGWVWPVSATALAAYGTFNTTTVSIIGQGSAGIFTNLQMANAAFAFILNMTYEI